jgi:hypothetical protein
MPRFCNENADFIYGKKEVVVSFVIAYRKAARNTLGFCPWFFDKAGNSTWMLCFVKGIAAKIKPLVYFLCFYLACTKYFVARFKFSAYLILLARKNKKTEKATYKKV